MAKFAVEYSYIEDVPRRHAVRPAHRDYLSTLADTGALLAAGAWTADNGGLLLFEADDESIVRGYLDNDPYKAAGVISATKITPWNALIGAWVS